MAIPIALQLYSVRHECANDFFGTIEQVAKMGYVGVEFAGYHGADPVEIRKVLDANGLVTEGTHTALHQFDEDVLGSTVATHHTLGTKFAIIPWLPEDTRNTPDACLATAERLTKLVETLAAHDLRTGFHAHAGDMHKLENGQSAWDIIAANTPDAFIMQYDTANGLMGGADPVQPIRDLPGRNASLHLKGWEGDKPAVVGEGQIDWNAVFEAAENGGGVEWYVVEHEEEVGSLEAVARCLENLRKLGKA